MTRFQPPARSLPPSGSGSTSQDPASRDSTSHTTQPPLLVGIDWADGEHAYALLDPQGSLVRGTVLQTPQAIAQLIDTWLKKFPNHRIDLCLETSRGPLINVLLQHPQVQIYPVNPNALANYRKAFAHGGGKNDPQDAALILRFLQLHKEHLRPLRPNLPLTRELAALCEDRRALASERVALAQQLKALLKAYFPAILALNPARTYADFVVAILQKYPTLEAVQKAGAGKLRKLFFARGTTAKIEERIHTLMT
ncbi:MAG TPA: IS110 family transposase, partial [Pirellulaceae bacterium]